MFKRKIEQEIINSLQKEPDQILLIDGARQIGKSYIIRHIGQTFYKNYIEINLLEDKLGEKLFFNVADVTSFYLQLSISSKGKLGNKKDTIIFLDEIQVYPNLLALLKFLRTDNKYTYIASGSMLGIALKKSISIPMGSIKHIHMYPMDFEEFLLANNIGEDIINHVHECFNNKQTLPDGVHKKLLTLFKYYLISGGLPDAVKAFVLDNDVPETRKIQHLIHNYYSEDASQYDLENNLKIKAIYDCIPSRMENKKKRIIANQIENKKNARYSAYNEEFDYLIASGIALDVKAVPTPVYPLIEGLEKNLIKLYLNDPGILTALLYENNINAIINNENSINLGSVYESAVASELKAHGYSLYYYDSRKKGEVDFLINDYIDQTVLPIEIKSGKNYSTHASLDTFISNKDYNVKKAYVFSNEQEIKVEENIVYYPIYMCMFLKKETDINAKIERITNIEWE